MAEKRLTPTLEQFARDRELAARWRKAPNVGYGPDGGKYGRGIDWERLKTDVEYARYYLNMLICEHRMRAIECPTCRHYERYGGGDLPDLTAMSKPDLRNWLFSGRNLTVRTYRMNGKLYRFVPLHELARALGCSAARMDEIVRYAQLNQFTLSGGICVCLEKLDRAEFQAWRALKVWQRANLEVGDDGEPIVRHRGRLSAAQTAMRTLRQAGEAAGTTGEVPASRRPGPDGSCDGLPERGTNQRASFAERMDAQ